MKTPAPHWADRALLAQPLHLVRTVDLVELEHSKLHLLVLVRDLLRLGVRLLLALLAATKQAARHVDRRVLRQPAQVLLEARAAVEQALLLARDALPREDLGLDLVERVRLHTPRALETAHEQTHR